MTTTPAPTTKTTRAKRAVPHASYQAGFAEQARKLCLLLGADDEDLAGFFDVPLATLQEWLGSVSEFADAVRAGRTLADADVGPAGTLHQTQRADRLVEIVRVVRVVRVVRIVRIVPDDPNDFDYLLASTPP